jgi:hypothetical protein
VTAVTIQVTQADIDRGTPSNPCDCPVWHAIARALPWLSEPFTVGPLGLCATSDLLGTSGGIALPDEAHKFMSRFDDGRPVRPFAFTLDLPAGLAGEVAGEPQRA